MKRLLFIIAVLISFMSYGQQIDSKGRKVVKSIVVSELPNEIQPYTREVHYDFTYNDKYEVIGLNNWRHYSDNRKDDMRLVVFELKNGVLNRTDYDMETGKKSDVWSEYEYHMDDNGNITHVFSTCYGLGGVASKSEWQFFYYFDTDKQEYKVNKITSYDHYRPSRNEPFYKQDFEWLAQYEYVDGKMMYGMSKVHPSSIKFYCDVPNDLNIDINRLYGPGISGNVGKMETLVGWVNMRSDYMWGEHGRFTFEYKFDDIGNLYQIEVRSAVYKNLKEIINIYYVW